MVYIAPGGGGGINHIPLDGSELNAIAVWPGDSATDIGPSNFVLDLDTVVITSNGNYTGTHDCFDISTIQLLGTTEGVASGAAFQIPVATDITIAGMFFITATESTPYFISNSLQETNISYALVSVTGQLNYQTSAGIDNTNRISPAGCWAHFAAVSTSSRTSTKVYVNGVNEGGTLATTATTPHADSELYIGTVDATNGDHARSCCDILIADTAYTDAQIRTLAENAFGHELP